MRSIKKGAKVGVALSGGVDSTAAAIRLMDEGYECFGITMYLFDLYDERGRLGPPEFLEEARRVADELGIEHHIVDLRGYFKDKVIDAFAKSYLAGETPNPCVLCNKAVKYGKLLDEALRLGADYMATGHYARVIENEETGCLELHKGCADRKDQAYVMYGLSQRQLDRILFPNGTYTTKQVVRDLVAGRGIFTAEKKDSMGICFAPDGRYDTVIDALYPGQIRPGKFVDIQGRTLGTHRGHVHYTIGQKRGLGIDSEAPLFVTAICPKKNEIVLGRDADTYAERIIIDDVHVICDSDAPIEGLVQLKMFNWGLVLEANAHVLEDGRMELVFLKPERAPVTGQHAVIYEGQRILGGGKIVKVIK